MTTTPYLTTASGQRYRLTGPELDTPRIADHVRESFELSAAFKRYSLDVKRWDLMALKAERAALMPKDDDTWPILEGVLSFTQYDFRFNRMFLWDHWANEFELKFYKLQGLVVDARAMAALRP